MPSYGEVVHVIREHVLQADWFEVYDLVEFIPQRAYTNDYVKGEYYAACNEVLELGRSGYRFLAGTLVPIISREELDEIGDALESPFAAARVHLQKSLEFLADRERPDPRNSIKESISAVEAAARELAKSPKATLGAALKAIPDLHPALCKAFSNLYGYTSDEAGIRHALTDAPEVQMPEARFMLVSCSAFVNFLADKLSRQT